MTAVWGEAKPPRESHQLPGWDELRRAAWDTGRGEFLQREAQRARGRVPRNQRLVQRIGRWLQPELTNSPVVRLGWDETVDVIVDQVAGVGQAAETTRGAAVEPASNRGQWGLGRRFHQMPCTRATTARRVELAARWVDEGAPILVLGDDDMVGLALARAGFTDVTVVDVDERLVASIGDAARRERLPLRALCHDLGRTPPRTLVRDHALVMMDPGYTVDWVELFLDGVNGLSKPHNRPDILLSFHLMSLGRHGLCALRAILQRHGWEPTTVHRWFNLYPVPRLWRAPLWAAARALLPAGPLRSELARLPFMTSDAVALKPADGSPWGT